MHFPFFSILLRSAWYFENRLKRMTCALLSTYLSMSSKFKAVASFSQCDPNFFLENQKSITHTHK